jgi:phage baseplate assembly protein W
MLNSKFKNTGKLRKDYIKKEKYKNKILESNKNPIGIKLPISPPKNSKETLFEMTYEISDQVKSNLKNLVLTRKGEYLCLPDFGTNLIDMYNSSELGDIEDIVMSEIQTAVSIFMPFVSLNNYSSVKIPETFDNPEYFEINIDYTISDIEEKNKLIIKLLTSR